MARKKNEKETIKDTRPKHATKRYAKGNDTYAAIKDVTRDEIRVKGKYSIRKSLARDAPINTSSSPLFRYAALPKVAGWCDSFATVRFSVKRRRKI